MSYDIYMILNPVSKTKNGMAEIVIGSNMLPTDRMEADAVLPHEQSIDSIGADALVIERLSEEDAVVYSVKDKTLKTVEDGVDGGVFPIGGMGLFYPPPVFHTVADWVKYVHRLNNN